MMEAKTKSSYIWSKHLQKGQNIQNDNNQNDCKALSMFNSLSFYRITGIVRYTIYK